MARDKDPPSRWIMRQVEFEISGEVLSAVNGAQGNASRRDTTDYRRYRDNITSFAPINFSAVENLIDITCNWGSRPF